MTFNLTNSTFNPALRLENPNSQASEFGKGVTVVKQTNNTLDLIAMYRTKSGVFDVWALNAIKVHRNISNNIHTAQV